MSGLTFTGRRGYGLLLLLLIVAGGALWFVNWWAARPLFLDEANVARNLFDRSFGGLFLPLDHKQYAPPLYLVAAKACGAWFGYGERALRLPALLGGLAAAAGLVAAGRRLQLGWWTLLPVALLFVNPTVLRYVGEIKPYATDLAVTATLLAVALPRPRPSAGWAVLGAVAPWLSLPAVFVLAGLPLRAFWTAAASERKRWLATVAVWLASFAVLYFTTLAPSVTSPYLSGFHARYFLPLPFATDFSWARLADVLLTLPRTAFGFTVLALTVGPAAVLTAVVRAERAVVWPLLLPILITLFASAAGRYSLLPRLLLFSLPLWWLLAALGARQWWRWSGERPFRWAVPVVWLLLASSTNVARHYTDPLRFSDARRLVRDTEAGYTPLLHFSSLPPYDYYYRIHPAGPRRPAALPRIADFRENPVAGRYALLYGGLTAPRVRARMRADSLWAVAQGATEVRRVDLYRAATLYVTLPNTPP